MPYVTKSDRRMIDDEIDDLVHALSGEFARVGDVNYAITRLVLGTLLTDNPHPHYDDYALAIGVLESAKLELYRRAVAPHEDAKIQQNGDVY